jgi:1,4-dihydroxy-2-naphthoate octaprenyltransferase
MAGEPVVFLLFGPALVMGGYFIQNQIFPDARSFILSLPFGFLTTALLFINEVPDFDTDIKVGKKTWVSLSGKKNAHVVYAILVCFAYFYLALSVSMGYLARQSLFAIAGIFFSAKAYMTLKNDFGNKENLLAASKMTIAGQLVTSLVLIYTQIYLR